MSAAFPASAPAAAGRVLVRGIDSSVTSWDACVLQRTHSTFCHLAGWARVVERTWGHAPCHLAAERDGRIVGLLPLFHVRSRLFGSFLVSSPNAVYGGAIADLVDARQSLIEHAKALARQLEVRYLDLRDAQETSGPDPDLVQRVLYVTFERSLTADEDELVRSLPRDIRRMCRLGPKNGLSASLGGAKLLDEFYDVYATSVRNLGTPVFPKRLFANFLDEFPGACDILVVRRGPRVAGAVMSFYFRDTVMPYYGGAYPAFHRAGVNNFMYFELMRTAAARGYRRFDFGRSKIGSGSYAFKRGWGMVERPLPYRYYLVGAAELPNITPTNPTLAPVIGLWKKLPVSITKLVGPLIVRGIP